MPERKVRRIEIPVPFLGRVGLDVAGPEHPTGPEMDLLDEIALAAVARLRRLALTALQNRAKTPPASPEGSSGKKDD